MRLYCHTCGKVTPFNSLTPTAISCEKCGHQQPLNSMARQKTGSVTGANLNREKGKGKLTNSARFDPPDVGASTDSPANTTTTTNVRANRTTKNNLQAKQNTSRGSGGSGGSGGSDSLAYSDHNSNFKKAIDLASKYGVAPVDIGSLLGSDPYAADGSAPEMTAAEANKVKLKLQRQGNAIEVRHEKIKLGRKIVKMATEQVNLIGDFVDHASAEIGVATKVVKNEIALTQFDIEQSKLIQTQELLVQQDIATDGTIALTEGIREEWALKLEKQNTRNSSIRIEIEGSLLENDHKREEMEARLIAA